MQHTEQLVGLGGSLLGNARFRDFKACINTKLLQRDDKIRIILRDTF